MGRYCSYLLPKQTGGTTQILIFETLIGMIGSPALYMHVKTVTISDLSQYLIVTVSDCHNIRLSL